MFEYHLTVLEKLNANQDFESAICYHYVIENKFNKVNGYRTGNKNEVDEHINKVIQRMNAKLDIYTTNNKPAYNTFDIDSLYRT